MALYFFIIDKTVTSLTMSMNHMKKTRDTHVHHLSRSFLFPQEYREDITTKYQTTYLTHPTTASLS